MISVFGVLVLAVLACSTTALKCSCPKVVRPVCGTDGRLYPNPCDARCHNADVAHPGRCLGVIAARPQCACDRRRKPVCGSDGQTYTNDCLLNCATIYNSKLSIVYYGACNEINDKPECTCDNKHNPVCGSDGVTYDNDCWLNCATIHNSRLSIAHTGFCPEDKNVINDEPECTCADNHNPVCGSDGVIYDNDCWLNCATIYNSRLSIAHTGYCQDSGAASGNQLEPECTCDDNHSPVCGSDGVTYNNDCWLNCATKYNSRLSVAYLGFCKDSDKEDNPNKEPGCMCDNKHSPVCGSDGVTYDNDCWLNCATIHNSRLRILHSGFCSEQGGDSVCTCTRNLEPVCGSDGVTYNNECLLRCAGAQKIRDGACVAPMPRGYFY